MVTAMVQLSHNSVSLRETTLCGEKLTAANRVWTLSEYEIVQVNNALL